MAYRPGTPRVLERTTAPESLAVIDATSLPAKGSTRSRTRNAMAKVIWTIAIVSSQSARALDSSAPVGGNNEGKRMGRSPMPDPSVRKMNALMAFTILIGR
jgi:hypothetical protein